MRRSSAPTLKDVAREAGVSPVTVSVVLNGSTSGTRVSEKTRTRIVEVAQQLKYRPNSVAQGLARRRMDTIGVVAVIGDEPNMYFLEIINGILSRLTEFHQNLLIFSLRPDEDLVEKAPLLFDGRVDGLIFLGISQMTAETAEPFIRRGIPFVIMHNTCDTPDLWNLDVKSQDGTRQLVTHLTELGHRRILYLTGDLHVVDVRRRLAGYRQALDNVGVPFDDNLVIPGVYSAVSGRERMRQILREEKFDPLPTAVCCGNDAIASGCMEALKEYGLRVPEDISVVGFDDTLTARLANPSLTTVRQPFHEMAQRAVSLVMAQIAGDIPIAIKPGHGPEELTKISTMKEEHARPHPEYFDVELALRASSGPPTAPMLSPPYRRDG